jgi:hypothetical protein
LPIIVVVVVESTIVRWCFRPHRDLLGLVSLHLFFKLDCVMPRWEGTGSETCPRKRGDKAVEALVVTLKLRPARLEGTVGRETRTTNLDTCEERSKRRLLSLLAVGERLKHNATQS